LQPQYSNFTQSVFLPLYKKDFMKNSVSGLSAPLLYLAMIALSLSSCKNKTPDDPKPTKLATEAFPQAKQESVVASSENFIVAARVVTPCVVHIKTIRQGAARQDDFFDDNGRGGRPVMGSGSGVIISADGYIATNNHVIENADQVEVVFPDRRSYLAKLVGRDPNTDLALLKVDVKDLSFVALGNSDSTQVGEWVLAVGYPYSLNTTVTAGIISAKGRSIGIINSSGSAFSSGAQASSAIESFIQTDAAINPGNSGGALVNMNGQLIGINTAIASLTGSYAGYAFAIPVNLVKKIMEDLREFGSVKRGLLGVSFPAPAAEDQYLKQQGINPASVKGVFITGIQKGGAADQAGLDEGDIIQSINGIAVYSSAEFSERIARQRPGDKIKLDYLRNGNVRSTTATLKQEEEKSKGDYGSLQNIFDKLGARFEPLSAALKERYELDGGVLVAEVRRGGFFDQLGIPAGSVLVYINGKQINSPEDISEALVAAQNSRVQILGIAPDGSRIAFNFSLGT
jgi:Do/DeqQ family serine protease